MLERQDALHATSSRLRGKIDQAKQALERFVAGGPCYCGVSWGKDSVAVAGLIAEMGLDVPIVWIRVEPIANPDCALVRDTFLDRFALRYEEVEVDVSEPGSGFDRAARLFGRRYISGIRKVESFRRRMRMGRWGHSSRNTCAPIGWWSTDDVFGYLALHDLPVHPAYACSRGGLYARDAIRVDVIGGLCGRGGARDSWERIYYPDMVDIGDAARAGTELGWWVDDG
jgi:phosphoadenosine phosphosulfate reductase